VERAAITEQIVRAVRRHMPLAHYRLFYFGSRAAGCATPRSDYDVGIQAGAPVPGEAIVKIEWDLDEIPILQKIDLVDFYNVSASFTKRAMQAIQVIDER